VNGTSNVELKRVDEIIRKNDPAGVLILIAPQLVEAIRELNLRIARAKKVLSGRIDRGQAGSRNVEALGILSQKAVRR